jgi:hypothetical protein
MKQKNLSLQSNHGGGLQNIQEKERWQLFSNSTSHYERRAGLNKITCSSDRGGSL